MFREILDVDDKERQLLPSQGGNKEETYDSELKAVELLIGDDLSKKELNSLKALQVFNSLIIHIQASSKNKRKKSCPPQYFAVTQRGGIFYRVVFVSELGKQFLFICVQSCIKLYYYCVIIPKQ